MKTTWNIDDSVVALLKREAARQGRTMSELVESALRSMFRAQRRQDKLPDLRSFSSGGHLVDIADRESSYQAMASRCCLSSTPTSWLVPTERHTDVAGEVSARCRIFVATWSMTRPPPSYAGT